MDEIDGIPLDEAILGEVGVRTYRGVRQDDLGGATPVRVSISAGTTEPADQGPRRRELDALCALPPRGPATLLDFGFTRDGRLYTVYPLEPSLALAALLRARSTLPLALAARIAADVASDLGHLHALRPPIVHGALHPQAILLDASGVARVHGAVLYFDSMCRAAEATVGGLGHLAPYFSPEQAENELHAAGPAADVFALASLVFEMIMGAPAFARGNRLATTINVRLAVAPPLDGIEEKSPPLAGLVRSMWSRDPADRPELGAALETLSRVAGDAADARRALAALAEPTARPASVLPRPQAALPRFHESTFDTTERAMQVPNHIPDGVVLPAVDPDTVETPRPDHTFEPATQVMSEAMFGPLDATAPLSVAPRPSGDDGEAIVVRWSEPSSHPAPEPARDRAQPGWSPGLIYALIAGVALGAVVLVALIAVLMIG
ncbi:MAG: protein kinase [Sandaracinaceae bacterium]